MLIYLEDRCLVIFNEFIPQLNYGTRGLYFVPLKASYSKILDPVSFSQNIHNYGVTPIFIENIIALSLPWIELFIGIGLIFNICLYEVIAF